MRIHAARLVSRVLIPIMAASAPATARTAIPPNIDVSAQAGNEAEDAIAVNPTNPLNIVAMSVLPDVVSGIFEGISFDSGQTWTRQVIGDGNDDLGLICCDQQLAQDEFGNLWMVYLLNTNGNVPIGLSTDGGLTWTKVTEIVPTKPKGSRSPKHVGSKGLQLEGREEHGEKGTSSADQPSISAWAGSVWVSWTSYPAVVVRASGAPVTGLGQFGAFSEPETVPTTNGRGNYGDTAVGPDGQLLVIYEDSTIGQASRTSTRPPIPTGWAPRGSTTPVFVAISRVGGFEYLPVQPNRSVDAEANLGFDRSERAGVGSTRSGPRRSRTRATTWTSCPSSPTTTGRAGAMPSG